MSSRDKERYRDRDRDGVQRRSEYGNGEQDRRMGSARRKRYIFKEGDWRCADPNCRNQNFARREKCNLCGMQKPDKLSRSPSRSRSYEKGRRGDSRSRSRSRSRDERRRYSNKQDLFKFKDGDWKCDRCNNINFAWRNKCNMCKEPKENNSKNDVSPGYREKHRDGNRERDRDQDNNFRDNYRERDRDNNNYRDRDLNRDKNNSRELYNNRYNDSRYDYPRYDTKFSSNSKDNRGNNKHKSRSLSANSLFSSHSSISYHHRRRDHKRRSYRSKSKSPSLSPKTVPILPENDLSMAMPFPLLTKGPSASDSDTNLKMRFKEEA